MNRRSKLPSTGQVAQVFAVTCLMIYGWTLYRFLERLPSYLYYLNFGEIASIYSYALVINLVEALLFLAGIYLVNLLLPRRLFSERFVARGALFSVLGVGYLIYVALAVGESKAFQFPEELLAWSPLVLLGILVLVILATLVNGLNKVSEGFADRAVIFLYILLPVTAAGLLVFLLNNLF